MSTRSRVCATVGWVAAALLVGGCSAAGDSSDDEPDAAAPYDLSAAEICTGEVRAAVARYAETEDGPTGVSTAQVPLYYHYGHDSVAAKTFETLVGELGGQTDPEVAWAAVEGKVERACAAAEEYPPAEPLPEDAPACVVTVEQAFRAFHRPGQDPTAVLEELTETYGVESPEREAINPVLNHKDVQDTYRAQGIEAAVVVARPVIAAACADASSQDLPAPDTTPESDELPATLEPAEPDLSEHGLSLDQERFAYDCIWVASQYLPLLEQGGADAIGTFHQLTGQVGQSAEFAVQELVDAGGPYTVDELTRRCVDVATRAP